MQENGPWEVDVWFNGKVVLQSQDFEHDVSLIISGDFKDDQEKREYAEEMCRRLNEYSDLKERLSSLDIYGYVR